MGKKSKARGAHQINAESKAAIRQSPNWALLAISIVGMALAGYLTFKSLTGGSLRGCSAGSGCEVVLSSRWATMLGLPTAVSRRLKPNLPA